MNNRVSPELNYGDALLVLTCLVGRHLRITQFLLREILSPFLAYFYQRADKIVYAIGLVHFAFIFLGMPTEYWNASVGRIVPRLFEPTEGARRLGIDRRLADEISTYILFSQFAMHFSLSAGVAILVGYFVNLIIRMFHPQHVRQELPERENALPIPENPNPQQIDELNQQMLNEALRRSVEET